MTIRYAKNAVKAIGAMDSAYKRRIRQGIEGIPKGDIKPLQGYPDGRQRLRIGKYRIVFRVESENILHIMDIGSRGDIYK